MDIKNSLNTDAAGALVTDIDDIYNAFYAYHNCRSPLPLTTLRYRILLAAT